MLKCSSSIQREPRTSLSDVTSGERDEKSDDPIVIVSSDTHVGPRLQQDLRPYCPNRYLTAFDDFVERDKAITRSRMDAPLFHRAGAR